MKPEPGTYVLFCSAKASAQLRVGRLGRIGFRPGIYAYVGSALGPGGLRARLAHHLRATRTPRWHIDYLRGRTRIERVWYSYGPERREHQWATVMGTALLGATPVAGFGSSDCDCESHLFFFEAVPSLHTFTARLRMLDGGHRPVHEILWVPGEQF